MGNILNSKESNINVLLLGLGGSGKTHLLYNALLEEGWQDKVKKGNSSYAQKDKNPRTQVNQKYILLDQTIGYNSELFAEGKREINVWDIGSCNIYGGEQYGEYYPSGSHFGIQLFLKNISVDGVIWVVNIQQDIE